MLSSEDDTLMGCVLFSKESNTHGKEAHLKFQSRFDKTATGFECKCTGYKFGLQLAKIS